MPNKAVAAWTQVPVVAANLLSIHYDRLNPTGSANNMTVVYEVKDDAGAVRAVRSLTQQVASYPITAANIVAAVNAAEGT
jgi:hypothetical protein